MKKKQLLGSVLDEVQLPHNKTYYDRMHDKIMARIEDTEMEAPIRPARRSFEKSKQLLREQWRHWLAPHEP
ncbi:MAG TPA: hypothetical protein VIG33_10815 [Pseudobdellovibrionaceae bacterium]|jgi:hypothetical protein